MTERTPGQIAYEAFWRVLAPRYGDLHTPYGGITPLQVEAWDAAAQAVLEAFVSSAAPRALPREDDAP